MHDADEGRGSSDSARCSSARPGREMHTSCTWPAPALCAEAAAPPVSEGGSQNPPSPPIGANCTGTLTSARGCTGADSASFDSNGNAPSATAKCEGECDLSGESVVSESEHHQSSAAPRKRRSTRSGGRRRILVVLLSSLCDAYRSRRSRLRAHMRTR